MHTMEDLKNLLLEMDCAPEQVAELVNGLGEVGNGHRRFPVCIALAVYLKFLVAHSGGDDPEQELELILDLAEAYGVDVRQDD